VKELRNYKEHGFDDIWVSAKEKHAVEESKSKRRKGSEEEEKIVYQGIADCMRLEMEERHSSLSKLGFFQLLCSERYDQYAKTFPDAILETLRDFCGPVFDYIRLKNELKVLFLLTNLRGNQCITY
jgi:hypothetical protein